MTPDDVDARPMLAVSPVVEVEDVGFSYRRRPVLDGACWSVGRGVTTLLGPNGAGKTTLIKCLVGLLRPSSGSIRVFGQDMGDRGERQRAQRRIGFVPQSASLPGVVRVRDAVGYAGWLSGLPGRQLPARVEATLAELGLHEFAARRVRTLSNGQRQRVALATGVVHDPELLILDEPTVGLDPGQRLNVRESIQTIAKTRAVILSTHLTEDAQYLSDTVAVLVGGRMRYQGSLRGLIDRSPASRENSRPGSEFERAYDDLMRSLGGSGG